MNKAFVARVKHLRASGSSELHSSNWPYLVAVQIDMELKNAKERALTEARNKEWNERYFLNSFTVNKLLQQKPLPFGDIQLSGIVTKVDMGLSGLAGNIFLDNKIKCEFEISPVDSRMSRVELQKRGDALFTVFKDRGSRIVDEKSLFKVGQRVQITGQIQKKTEGALVFRFDMRSAGFVQFGSPVAP